MEKETPRHFVPGSFGHLTSIKNQGGYTTGKIISIQYNVTIIEL